MGLTDRRYTTKLGQQPIFDFLSRKIRNWLSGTEEIDKIHLCTDLRLFAKDSIEFRPFFKALPFLISSKVGWVDQTYDGMPLILRASDGQALLMFFASGDRSIYLIRCEYNFRRGRCLGSFERNEKALQKIRGLMSIASRLSSQNPELAEDAKEKLREECSKFNKYNERATELDLLTDSNWRSKGQRDSPWTTRYPTGEGQSWDEPYPVDITLRHAYQFTKAFETRDVLPDVDEFKPPSEDEMYRWRGRLQWNYCY